MIERTTVYYDGTAGPVEPGQHGAYAFIIFSNDVVIHKQVGFIQGVNTTIPNSHAEYRALIEALRWLIANKKTDNHVRFYGDTLMIVNQLNREYPFHSISPRSIWLAKPEHEPWRKLALEAAKAFRDIQFSWVSKKQIHAVRELAENELLAHGINPARITAQNAKAAALEQA